MKAPLDSNGNSPQNAPYSIYCIDEIYQRSWCYYKTELTARRRERKDLKIYGLKKNYKQFCHWQWSCYTEQNQINKTKKLPANCSHFIFPSILVRPLSSKVYVLLNKVLVDVAESVGGDWDKTILLLPKSVGEGIF